MAVMLKLFSGKMGVVENLACRKEAQESFEPGRDNRLGLQEKRAVFIFLLPNCTQSSLSSLQQLPSSMGSHGAPTAQDWGHFQLHLRLLGLLIMFPGLSVLGAFFCTPDVKPYGLSLETFSCEASLQAGTP